MAAPGVETLVWGFQKAGGVQEKRLGEAPLGKETPQKIPRQDPSDSSQGLGIIQFGRLGCSESVNSSEKETVHRCHQMF